jgi:hypothetical protein
MQNDTQYEPTAVPSLDTSGAHIFGGGDLGSAHVEAHHHLDSGDPEAGYQALRAALEGRSGSGSDWVHLQWHLLVFEIALGDFARARVRFEEHILPAVPKRESLTDGPAALWRFPLAAPHRRLCRQAVWDAAREGLGKSPSAFIELHNLLAIAGASDLGLLDAWLSRHTHDCQPGGCALCHSARGLRAFASSRWDEAHRFFVLALPQLNHLGGSRAQLDLFAQIDEAALSRATRGRDRLRVTRAERVYPYQAIH